MYAIIAKYVPATTHRGSRYSVRSVAGRTLEPFDYQSDRPGHAAIRAHMERFPQFFADLSPMFGALPDESGYVAVLVR